MEALSLTTPFVKKRHTYFGMQFSLLNLLGPISEIALRNPDTSYLHSGWVWANFVQPRADFVIGSPAFSKRLALFAVDSRLNAGTIIPQFLEFGLGLRYYPF